jgi:hypothetical protein
MHYMDTHHPYLSPERIQEKFGRTYSTKQIKQLSQNTRSGQDEITDEDITQMEYVYDCTVRYVDEQIGRILDQLRTEGELENSMIVVTADHGEGFGEFGKFGHADQLWDTLVAVPLIVYRPDGPSTTVDGQAPLRLLKESIVDGTGLFDLIESGADHVFAEAPDYRDELRGVRGRKYKLIDRGDELLATKHGDCEETLVDTETIPEETFEALQNGLDRDFERIHVGTDVDREEFKADLAALGYLEE